ncbi:ArsC family reductase [Rhizobium sp. KAs_5_22]|uniref:ArsC family reductase n=1 Tax=Ciceribacter selenitireducens TaxID=448181 RepID=UPI00048BB0AB|nr:ArsC family reductase [Ciceribacter selenitireducens]PPJ48109.1 ArsC family reductase [Rhizobium sp. KAs_5_22]
MQARIYGIKNCDTMKKARLWLEEHGVDYAFHDYKVSGIDRDHLERWCAEAGWQTVLNRAGTTFRNLPDAAKLDLDPDKAIELMLAQPSMIKRPVLEAGGKLLIGFKPEVYAAALKA